MSLANLSDLQTAVSEWLYRTGDTALATRASDLVALFEADFIIDPDMRALDMEAIDTSTISSASVALPSGDLNLVRVKVLGSAINVPDMPLQYVTPDEAAKLDGTEFTTGDAKHYTLIGSNIVITPQKWAPIGASMEIVSNKFVPLATAPGNVNWLLQKYPNLYLYGALMQAAAYIDDDQATAKWKAGRDEAMAKLAVTLRKNKYGAGPLRVTPSASFIR